MSFIESEHATHFLVDLQFVKAWRVSWPSHVPASGGDKIALMHTIPKMSAELDRYDPAKRGKKV